MAKILRFRRGRNGKGEGQRGLFDEASELAPRPDLTLKGGRSSDARPVGPEASDAVPLPEDRRAGEASPETQRRVRRRRRLAVGAIGVLFVGGAFAAVFGERGFLDVRRARADLQSLGAEVAAQQERVLDLKAEVDRMRKEPHAVERIAREKLGYARSGEIVVVWAPPSDERVDGAGRSAIVPGAFERR